MTTRPKIGERIRICINGYNRGGDLADGYWAARPASIVPDTWAVKHVYPDGTLYVVRGRDSWDFVRSWIRA